MKVKDREGLKPRLRGKKIEDLQATISGPYGTIHENTKSSSSYILNWLDLEPETEEDEKWLEENMPEKIKQEIARKEAEKKRKAEKFPEEYLEKLLHLYTGHIRPETYDFLLKVTREDETMFPFPVYRREFTSRVYGYTPHTTGVFIHLFDPEAVDVDNDPNIPEDLKILLKTVIQEDVQWLALDEGSPCASEYDWPAGKDLPIYPKLARILHPQREAQGEDEWLKSFSC